MANYVKGIGDPKTLQNEILPSFDAKIFQYITQNSPGICAVDSNRFALTNIDRGVSIGPGMMQAFGYFGMSDSPIDLTFVFPSGSSQYSTVYAEINLSVTPHQFAIKATPQSSTTAVSLFQDNLAQMPSGLYQLPLYSLTINSNQTITSSDQRQLINKPEHAKNCEQAINSTNAVNLNGTIASGVIAITQAITDNSTKVATTALVNLKTAITRSGITLRYEPIEVLQYVSRRRLYIDITGDALARITNGIGLLGIKMQNISTYNSPLFAFKFYELGSINQGDNILFQIMRNTTGDTMENYIFNIELKNASKITLRMNAYTQLSNSVNFTEPPVANYFITGYVKDVFIK